MLFVPRDALLVGPAIWEVSSQKSFYNTLHLSSGVLLEEQNKVEVASSCRIQHRWTLHANDCRDATVTIDGCHLEELFVVFHQRTVVKNKHKRIVIVELFVDTIGVLNQFREEATAERQQGVLHILVGWGLGGLGKDSSEMLGKIPVEDVLETSCLTAACTTYHQDRTSAGLYIRKSQLEPCFRNLNRHSPHNLIRNNR